MAYADGKNPVLHDPAWPTVAAFRAGPAIGYWAAATLLSLIAAVVLVTVFRESAIPPGGDPGNWASTSYAYLGWAYPSQLIPLAYPPVMFPFLGVALLVAGPVQGVTLFAGVLMVALGLSTAALATTLLKSRVVALVVVAALLADPPTLAMFFWGAYPNLLAFVFLNLAIVGLLRAGQGHPSVGAAQFWGFFGLAMLTHSLVGVALATTAALYLILGNAVPMADRTTVVRQARVGALESSRLAARALFASRGGRIGLVAFSFLVGGYYLLTWLAGIPHPYYFASNAAAFRAASEGSTLSAVLPGVPLTAGLVFATLLVVAIGGVLGYAIVRDRNPEWLTAPVVLLVSWIVALSLLIIGGFLAQIVTDYHRFGFLYLAPLGLGLGYLVERTWVLGRPAPMPGIAPSRRRRPWRPTDEWGRPAVFGIVAGGVIAVVIVTATLPALPRDETVFTRVGHDVRFTQAVGAIRSSGTSGAVLTVTGADKWVRELTGENTYAPYTSTSFLFYPSQATDSELAYYALIGHVSVSNGMVAATLQAVHSPYTTGIPDYSAYVLGAPRATLRVPPQDIRLLLHDSANGTTFPVNLSTDPTVVPPSAVGQPMTVTYTEPLFDLTASIVTNPRLPDVNVTLTATTSPPYSILALNASVTPPAGASALPWASGAAGACYWTVVGGGGVPLTFSNVTPAAALRGTTEYDPGTGGPAALASFVAPPNGSTKVSGAFDFATPSAGPFGTGLAGVFSTPSIWASLGVRFVLLLNETAAPAAYQGFPAEIPYLETEYSLPVLYWNAEWTVLEIPRASLGPAVQYGPAPIG